MLTEVEGNLNFAVQREKMITNYRRKVNCSWEKLCEEYMGSLYYLLKLYVYLQLLFQNKTFF